MNKQGILLIVLGIICVTVWTSLFLNLYRDKSEEVGQHERTVVSNDISYETEEGSTADEESDSREKIDYSTRGIHPGDFDHLAKNKVISVEILLENIQ